MRAWIWLTLAGAAVAAAPSCDTQLRRCTPGAAGDEACTVDAAHMQACSCSSGAGGAGGAGGAPASTSSDRGTGAGGAGGQGGSEVCRPGATAACYSGPPGTRGVGVCKGGRQTCFPDGAAWGPCVGEIVPRADDCATAADEDCDGAARPCVEDPPWSRALGVEGRFGALDLDAASNVAIAGQVAGALDFGAGPVASAAPSPYVAEVDSAGNPLWSRAFGGATGAARAVVFSGADVVVAGAFGGAIDLGGGPLPSAGKGDVFVGAFAPTGAARWGRRFGGPGDDAALAVAIDPLRHVVIAGIARSPIDFGGGSLGDPGPGAAFVAELDALGGYRFARQFGSTTGGELGASSVAVDPAGNLVLLLEAGAGGPATVDLGGGPLTGTVFVAKLQPDGSHLWSKAFSVPSIGAPFQGASVVRADATGAVVFTGVFGGQLDLGAGAFSSHGAAAYVARLDADGALAWAFPITNAGPGGLGLDPAGVAIVSGGLGGAFFCGIDSIASAGERDVFLLRLDPSGACLSGVTFGDASEQFGRALAVTRHGAAVLLGNFLGQLGFGDVPLQSAGDPGKPAYDTFLAKIRP